MRKLRMTRVDLLGDDHEGSVTVGTLDEIKKRIEEHKPPLTPATFADFRKHIRGRTYVSCWSMDPAESWALWRLYCPSNDGVAIQTTYDKLEKSIRSRD